MVGVGGVIKIKAKKGELLLKDNIGDETIIECIVLSHVCHVCTEDGLKIWGSNLLQDKDIFTQGGVVD